MAVSATLAEMFRPARYPAPALDGLGVAWRYSLAILFYLLIAAAVIAAATWPAWVDPSVVPSAGPTASPGGTPTGSGDPTVEINPGTEIPSLPLPLLVTDLTLGLASLVVVHWRRRWPLTVYLVLDAIGLIATSGGVAVLWAWMSLASRRDLRKMVIALAFSTATSVASVFLPWNLERLRNPLWPLVWGFFFTIVLALLGMYYGVRQDRTMAVQHRAENADRDREFAVLQERQRIAREMHDVLAHRISLVSMHAGALAYRSDLSPEKTREIAHIIQENAHASLTDLRSVLSTLRDVTSGPPEAPQPTLRALRELVDEAEGLGQRVSLRQSVDVGHVPQVTARHAYRIIQECLTNARKHAPYAPVELTVGGTPRDGLALRVTNPITAVTGGVPGARLGLIGIGERAQMLGGRLSAGEQGGHFVVDVWLPWQ